jgi:hypothetical protein
VIEGVEKEYPFLLLKGKQEIFFNENNTEIPVSDEEILEESTEIDREQILLDIEKLKKDSVRKAQEELSRHLEIVKEKTKREKQKKEKALRLYLESARENLVDEFTTISQRIKKEVFDKNDEKYSEIRETIDNRIEEIRNSLGESLSKNFQKSSQIIDKSIKQLVKELWEKNINPRVDKELHNIATEIHEKVSEIDKNLNSKLDKKADRSLVEGVSKEIDIIRDANIELNNSLNKGVQKALSRVGNVDKKIVEISEKFDRKISETEQEVTEYFNEKLTLIKEETIDITDEARKYFQNLIQESRDGLLSEIRTIKNEKPVEYILETKKSGKVVKDWDSIEKEWNTKIHDKIENVKTDLRKYVTVYASGGGTNATQYQDGGTMNGDLNVTGAYLSAGVNLLDIFGGGGGGLTNPVEVLEFDTAYVSTGSEPAGSMYWNPTDETVDLVHDGAVQQIGQEMFIKVRNASGSTIQNGTPVYFDGRQGNRPKIYPAQSDLHSTSAVMGITTQDISDGDDGFITSFGYVRQIKTNYSGAGDWGTTWNEGDNLYVSKTITGQLTNVEPSAPHHSDVVGQVGIVGALGVGSIFVSIRHHQALEDLSDVNGTALTTTGQVPTWNNSLSAFDFNYNITDYLPLSGGTLSGNLSANSVTVTAAEIGRDLVDADAVVLNGGRSLLSRFWTYVKSKLDLGQTVGGSWAFSSTTRPTSSGTGTPASNSLITFADALTQLDSLIGWNLIPFNGSTQNTINFGGSNSLSLGAVSIQLLSGATGVTASAGYVFGSTNGQGILTYEGSEGTLFWSKRLKVRFGVAFATFDGDAVGWFWVGCDATSPPSGNAPPNTVRGYGLRFDNSGGTVRITPVTHDGTNYIYGTPVTHTNTIYTMDMYLGTMNVYNADKTLVATVSGGRFADSSANRQIQLHCQTTLNNGVGNNYFRLRVNQLQFKFLES